MQDAALDLPADKVVTYEDAYKVLEAELRGRNIEDLRAGGVGATLVAAAELNAQSGLVPPPQGSLAEGRHELDLAGEEAEDNAEQHKYQPMESADLTKSTHGEGLDRDPTQIHGTEEEPASLMSSNADKQVPSHGSENLPARAETTV